MRVFNNNRLKIYVYAGDHPPPHCHVVFRDGNSASIDIPLIEARYGYKLSVEVRDIIEINLDKICEAWEKLNPMKY